MNSNEIEGELKNGLGKAKSIAGQVIDDPQLEADGDIKRAEGRVQSALGQAQDKLAEAADRAAARAARVGDQAREAYATVQARVQKTAEQVTPFVKEQPYTALGLAALGGLLFGLVYAGRGPKIIYVKPPRLCRRRAAPLPAPCW